MRHCVNRIIVSADEARNFVRVVLKQVHVRERFAVLSGFGDKIVIVRHCCKRRHMRDCNNLSCARNIAHFSDTTCDILPEIPVSISSNTIVPMSSTPARIFLNASINLDISPPEIIFASGFNGSPTFGEIINSTLSIPFADISSTSSDFCMSTLKVEPPIPKSQSSFVMSFSNLSATFRLSSDSFLH